MKILIADDMKVARMVLEMALKKLGHEVVATSDGQEAWQAFRQGDFPVLITDWQMPMADGLELCRLIRAEHRPRYTYILMVTSLDTKPDYMTAIDAGTDDFLVKPFDEGMLAARLHVAERIGGLLSEMQQLSGLLPICPTCKRIRDEHDQWTQVETYVATHLHSVVSQSLCPSCEATRNAGRQNLRAKLNQVRQDTRKQT
jgi:sigma-B regulation protein RsbU (phosphoserine phosphatase)